MSLHVISRNNNRWRQGTWFECFDDGCREVEVYTENNRMKVKREIGFILPFSEIQDYVTTAMRKGLKRFDKKIGDGISGR